MIRRPPRSTLFPYTRSSDLLHRHGGAALDLQVQFEPVRRAGDRRPGVPDLLQQVRGHVVGHVRVDRVPRSEEHTSELQSLAYLVCRLLLEKKNKLLAV